MDLSATYLEWCADNLRENGLGGTRHRLAQADAMQWLLGDQGSGFWLGREAARVAARALSRGEAGGRLVRLVAGALLAGEVLPDAVHVARGPQGQGSGNGAEEAQERSSGNGRRHAADGNAASRCRP